MNLKQVTQHLAETTGEDGTLCDVVAALVGQTQAVYTEIESKGGTLPAEKNMDNFASAIETIESAEEVL